MTVRISMYECKWSETIFLRASFRRNVYESRVYL